MNRWEGNITINASPEEVWQTLITIATEGNPTRIVEPLTDGPLKVGSKFLEYIYYEQMERIQKVETEVTELVPTELLQRKRKLTDEEDAKIILTESLRGLPNQRTKLSFVSEVEGELRSTVWPSDEAFKKSLRKIKERVERR